MADLQAQIDELWAHRAELEPGDKSARKLIREAIDLLDTGQARVAEVIGGRIVVHEWLKQAILLLFRVSKMKTIELGPFEYADKVPLKRGFAAAGVRVVPGASARYGSFLERGVVLMPSYVNIGAYVGHNTMVDTWATVGLVRPDRRQRPPVRRRRHRRCARAAAGRARGGRGRLLHRQPLHRGRGRPRRAQQRARRRPHPHRHGAGDRRPDRRRGRPGQGAAEQRGHQRHPHPLASAATSSACPCALVIKHLRDGERHDKSKLNDLLRDHGATV